MTENPLNVCKLCNGISAVYAIFFDDDHYVNICTDPQMSDVHICRKCIKSLQCCRELRDELHVEPTVSFVTWIPVSERLPEDPYRKLVIKYTNEEGLTVDAGHYADRYRRWCVGGRVTHWAELPAPPAGEEGEG